VINSCEQQFSSLNVMLFSAAFFISKGQFNSFVSFPDVSREHSVFIALFKILQNSTENGSPVVETKNKKSKVNVDTFFITIKSKLNKFSLFTKTTYMPTLKRLLCEQNSHFS